MEIGLRMDNTNIETLSRRERQIMEIRIRLGKATAEDVQKNIENAPSYTTIRTLLRILEQKGKLYHKKDKKRFLYFPLVNKEQVKKSALKNLLFTYFEGSAANAVSALLEDSDDSISEEDFQRLEKMINEHKSKEK